jgi:hypothetical protein
VYFDQPYPPTIHFHLPATIPLPADIRASCAALNLTIKDLIHTPAIVRDLHGSWTRSLAGRGIDAERFETIFDNYLEKRHGYGPRKACDDTDYTYRHPQGYNRDPALVVPALRYLLPIEQATVRDASQVYVYLDGAILCQAQEAVESPKSKSPDLSPDR